MAMADSYSIVHDHVLNASSVLTNDMLFMNNGSLTASLVSGPNHASITLNTNGTFELTPDAGYTGTISLVYQAAANGESSNATVTINVSNIAPLLTNGSFSLLHDRLLIDSNWLATASDADGDAMTVTIVSGPSFGELAQSTGSLYNYAPASGWTGTDSVTITVSDGLATSNSATISMAVTNTAPIASNASFSVQHDLVLPDIDLRQYVPDSESDPLTISIVSGPSHGSLTQNDDGSYIYTPVSQYIRTDTLTFRGNDWVADSITGTITINVTHYAPTNNNTYSTPHDQTLLDIDFSANDLDGMCHPDWIGVVSGPNHGSLAQNSDGTFNYAPDAHYYGTDSVTITRVGGDTYGPWQNLVVSFTVTGIAPVVVLAENQHPIAAAQPPADGELTGPNVVPGNSRYWYSRPTPTGNTTDRHFWISPANDAEAIVPANVASVSWCVDGGEAIWASKFNSPMCRKSWSSTSVSPQMASFTIGKKPLTSSRSPLARPPTRSKTQAGARWLVTTR